MPDAAGSEPADAPFCRFLESTAMGGRPRRTARPTRKNTKAWPLPDWLRGLTRAWLVVPLIMHGGLFGFVVLPQPRSRIKLNWEVIDLLKIAGSQAASYLAQQQAANALMVARQFESFNRMSTFIVHDLKNLVVQLSLLIRERREAQRQSGIPAATCWRRWITRCKKMKLLLQKLNSGDSLEEAGAAGRSTSGAPGGALKARVRAAAARWSSIDSRPDAAGRLGPARARGRPPDPERDRGHAARRQRGRSALAAQDGACRRSKSPTPAPA